MPARRSAPAAAPALPDVRARGGPAPLLPAELRPGLPGGRRLGAHLALGREPLEAARAAKRVASEAVRDGLAELGAGAGPVDVFGLKRMPG